MSILSLTRKSVPVIAAILFPCMLSSCVDPALQAQQSSAHRAIDKRGGTGAEHEKFQKDQRNTMLQGTGLGAVLGAGAGYLLGDTRGALAGALIGGALGNKFGQSVAMKKATAQTTEANLDASIKDALAANARANARVGALRKELASYKTRISAARARNDTRELARIKGELNTLHKSVGQDVASQDQSIGRQQKLISQVPSSNSKYAKLNTTLRASSESRSALESERKQIASLMNSL